MKKLAFICFAAFIISGCSGTGKSVLIQTPIEFAYIWKGVEQITDNAQVLEEYPNGFPKKILLKEGDSISPNSSVGQNITKSDPSVLMTDELFGIAPGDMDDLLVELPSFGLTLLDAVQSESHSDEIGLTVSGTNLAIKRYRNYRDDRSEAVLPAKTKTVSKALAMVKAGKLHRCAQSEDSKELYVQGPLVNVKMLSELAAIEKLVVVPAEQSDYSRDIERLLGLYYVEMAISFEPSVVAKALEFYDKGEIKYFVEKISDQHLYAVGSRKAIEELQLMCSTPE